MSILHPNNENFKELTQGNELVVVDFFATWCGPCKMFGPILEEVANQYENGVKFAKIDIDENDELAMQYNIQAVPTILFLKNGTEIERHAGLMSKAELEEKIENNK